METMKNGFGPQFNGLMQPFDDSLYGYSSYNQWTSKVPSPLGSKAFPWGLNTVNHLGSVVSTQPMCFTNNTGMTSSISMAGSVAGMGGQMGSAAGAPCPYASGSSPYGLYNRDQCSSSIASLRLKAKQHASPVFGQYPPPAQSLSACQYASVGQGGI